MERVNLIKGDKEATDIIVNGLLKYAIDFYGKEYEDIIIQAIREISFYELSKHESFDSVIEILTGFPQKKNAHKYNTGCFLYPKNPKINSSYNDIIIYRQTTGLGAYLTIAHELFGHGVCSRINRIVEKDSKVYNRNGIALHGINVNEWHNRILNEGFMDYIAASIVDAPKFRLNTSEDYMAAKLTAKKMFDLLGKEKIVKSLVLYNYNIEDEIDELVENGYFNKLSLLNDERYEYEKKSKIIKSSVYKKKIKKQLKRVDINCLK